MKQKQYKRTTPDQRTAILNLLQNDVSMSIIAKSFKINKSTVSRIKTRYLNTNSVEDAQRRPKRKKISKRTFRSAIRDLSTKKYQSINVFRHILRSKYHIEISKSGAYMHLKRMGYVARIQKRKPFVSNANRLLRIKFAREHMNWSVEKWARVIWTDETSFERVRSRGVMYYYKDCFNDRKQVSRPSVQKGGGSIMFWGCFKNDRIGFGRFLSGSINATVYQDVLQHEALDSIAEFANDGRFIWMHDNAPPHRAKTTVDLIANFGWKTLQWPPFSPDLNPIENLWQIVKNQVYSGSSFQTIEELKDAVDQVWSDLDRSDTLRNLIASMPYRMREVIRRKGHPINY